MSGESTARHRHGLWRPSTARRKPVRTVSASSFVAHRGGAGRLEPEGRADRQRRQPWPVRVVGRLDQPEPHLQPAGILEDQAGQRPAERGPRRASGGSGGGPASGATSRKLTTPASSVTHRMASHQPSGASVGRAIPALNARSPIRTVCSRRNDGPGGGSASGTGGRIAAGRLRPPSRWSTRRTTRPPRPPWPPPLLGCRGPRSRASRASLGCRPPSLPRLPAPLSAAPAAAPVPPVPLLVRVGVVAGSSTSMCRFLARSRGIHADPVLEVPAGAMPVARASAHRCGPRSARKWILARAGFSRHGAEVVRHGAGPGRCRDRLRRRHRSRRQSRRQLAADRRAGSPRPRPRTRRPSELDTRPSAAASARRASASAWSLATSASSSSRRISRRTSWSGGATACASACDGTSLAYSPLSQESSRLRGCAPDFGSDDGRRIDRGQPRAGRIGVRNQIGAAGRAFGRVLGVRRRSTRGRRRSSGAPRAMLSTMRECYRAGPTPTIAHRSGARAGLTRAIGRLLPLDRGRGLGADVVDHPVDARAPR